MKSALTCTLFKPTRTLIAKAIAGNIARQWNNEHPPEEQIESLDIYKMSKVLSKTFDYKRHWKIWAKWTPKKEPNP